MKKLSSSVVKSLLLATLFFSSLNVALADGSIEKIVHDKDEYSVIKPADLVYDGNEKEATVAGPGDVTVLYSEDGTTWTEEKPVDAGTYQVKIVVDETESTEAFSISDPEWTFTIEKADQNAPEITATGTSAPGVNDGKIDGLETTMEISTDGGTTWVKVDYPEISDIIEWIISGEDPDVKVADCNLPAGEYQVRYAEDENHNASPITTVIVEEGKGYIDMVDEDSFEVVADGYCPETDGEVHFEVVEGNPTEFRAVILGVDSIAISEATYGTLDETDMFVVYIPNCDAGSYTIQVQFRNDAGAESPVYTFPIQVNLTKKYITNIWDDVVSIINKVDLNEPENLTKRFKAYQWYRDGEEIPGANLPYYNEEGGLYGEYYVEVTTIDGKELRTCSQEWHLVYGDVTMIVYPNPVVTTATVELSGDDMMTEHQLLITNVAGNMTFLKTTFIGKSTQIDMSTIPVGEYVVVVDGISTKVIKK